MSNTQSDESPDEETVFPFLINSLSDRGQTRFCKNLLVNLFEPGISPCTAEFTDIKIKSQIIEHYLKDICNLTQQYGIYTIEFSTPRTIHGKYVIQIDDIDLEFSKVFTEYIKSTQYHNSQRAKSIFTNEDYVKVIPLTIDATPLNYKTFLPDTQNNSLNLTVIHHENLNGTRNLTQQDIQTPSQFINEEVVQKTVTTTQQSISPIR